MILEESVEPIKNLNKLLDAVLEVDINLLERDDLGSMGFQMLRPYFINIETLFNTLVNSDLNDLPPERIATLNNLVTKTGNHYNEIINFKLTADAGEIELHQLKQLKSSIPKIYNEILGPIEDAIFHSHIKEQPLKKASEKAQEYVKQISKDAEAANEKISKIEAMLKAAQSAVADVGVSKHSKLFFNEAMTHKTASYFWLILTGVMIAIFLYATYKFLFKLPEEELLLGRSIQLGLAKLIGFSVLYYAVVLCARNYRANRHNFIVNKHRHNALNTFETFVEASKDDSTKNAVLMKATETIFSPATTGYLAKEPESHGNTQLLEVIRTIITKDQES